MSFEQSFKQEQKVLDALEAIERVVNDIKNSRISPYDGIDIIGTIYYNCDNIECVEGVLRDEGYLNENEVLNPNVDFNKFLDSLAELINMLKYRYLVNWEPKDAV